MGPVSQKGSVRPLPFVVKLDWLQHSTFVTAKVPYLLSSLFPIFHQNTHGPWLLSFPGWVYRFPVVVSKWTLAILKYSVLG